MPPQAAAKYINLQLPLTTLPPLQTTTSIDATINSTTKVYPSLTKLANIHPYHRA